MNNQRMVFIKNQQPQQQLNNHSNDYIQQCRIQQIINQLSPIQRIKLNSMPRDYQQQWLQNALHQIQSEYCQKVNKARNYNQQTSEKTETELDDILKLHSSKPAMAAKIHNAYCGRFTILQLLNMDHEIVLRLYKEIMKKE